MDRFWSTELWKVQLSLLLSSRDGHRLDPTRAYFWPAVNKRQSSLQPGYFLTRPKDIFFDTKGKKLKNLTCLGEIFQIQTQIMNGWPNPSHQKLTLPNPGQKFLTQTHHYSLAAYFIDKGVWRHLSAGCSASINLDMDWIDPWLIILWAYVKHSERTRKTGRGLPIDPVGSTWLEDGKSLPSSALPFSLT